MASSLSASHGFKMGLDICGAEYPDSVEPHAAHPESTFSTNILKDDEFLPLRREKLLRFRVQVQIKRLLERFQKFGGELVSWVNY